MRKIFNRRRRPGFSGGGGFLVLGVWEAGGGGRPEGGRRF